MKIVMATHNGNKLREIRALLDGNGLSDITLLTLSDIGYNQEIDETGTTFSENAYIKASVPARLGYYGLADDSGLEVDYLLGAPGVYSARFAGEPCNDAANNEKLLEELEDVPESLRTARYVSVISFVSPVSPAESFSVSGKCEGLILEEYRGEGGFGYDPLFYVPELHKTFAQVTMEEKNAVSHRGKATRLFIARLQEMLDD
ncbi:MAG: XTP/dITP diphosphatase [Clostridia bacterium]|nr:XTP/dITP diphosphatase [Clostridia bacterium]